MANPFIVDEARCFHSATLDGDTLIVIYVVFNTRTKMRRIDAQPFVGDAIEFELAHNSAAADFLTMQIESMITGKDGPASYSPTFWVADMPESGDKEH